MLPTEQLREHLAEIDRLIEVAGDDPELLGQVLDRLTEVHRLRAELADWVAGRGWDLVKRALLAGVSQDEIRERPYNYSTVLKIAREAGVPKKKPGPRRKRR